ncbi:hypothetical protein D9M71_590600 [compost metagenome]
MQFPEHRQQLFVADLVLVEHHQHHFGVAGQARADFFVGRVGGEAAGIADHGADHAFTLPEAPLGTPEAAQAKDRKVDVLEERPEQWGVFEDKVLLGQGHRGFAARQGLFRSRQDVFVHQDFRAQDHEPIPLQSRTIRDRVVVCPSVTPLSGAWSTRISLEFVDQLGPWNRAVEQITLADITAVTTQERQLFGGLDAFGDHLELEVVGHGDHR